MNNQEKQEYIKTKIVDAIFLMLNDNSLEDMTADEIANKADVSKRTLYKYYKSKKEMYLAIVKTAFQDLSQKIYIKLQNIKEEDPWYRIECIGREYMKYCLENNKKAKLILGFDEMEYIDEYSKWVTDIQEYSNKFELVSFINEYYEYHKFTPPADIAYLALYLWAEAQGIATLLMSKRKWIKEYYKIDEKELIEQHLKLSKKILGEKE